MSDLVTELPAIDLQEVLGINKTPELSNRQLVQNTLIFLNGKNWDQRDRAIMLVAQKINNNTEKSPREQIGAILEPFYTNKYVLSEEGRRKDLLKIVGRNIAVIAQAEVDEPSNPHSPHLQDVAAVIADPNDIFTEHDLSEAVKEGMRAGLLIQTP